MKFATQFQIFRRLTIAAACTAMAACGGGGGTTAATTPTLTATTIPDAGTITAASTATVANSTSTSTSTSTSAAAVAISTTAITDVRIQNTDVAVAQTNSPFTFGQAFVAGQLNPNDVLSGRLEDGSIVPLQVDVKATYADGSVRHAVISGILPILAAGTQRTVSLVKGGTAPAGAAATISGATRAGFSTSFHAKLNGVDYYASADDLLKVAASTTWLKGNVVTEWHVAAPLRNAAGEQHPHLSARFAVRWYDSLKKARVDVTVENDWAYEPAPQNFTYDAEVLVGGKSVYTKPGLNHLHHARWRKIFWFNGTEPALALKHNTAYLISTGALPNYDQSLVIPEDAITGWASRWQSSQKDPMGNGLNTGYMPTTGAHDDIGLLQNWAASYLLSQDGRLKEITLRSADLAGSFSSHYRDKKTGRPISLADYPYMSINGRYGDSYNPVTKQYEWFPGCAGAGKCDSPYEHDASHQPALAYLPYLVTGDYFYLEELQFWGMWYAFETNPGYRDNIKGIMSSEQVRGQAWAMRTLAEAAYITPDKDSLKTAFNDIVNNNLDWYTNTYVNNPQANKLGIITNGYAVVYDGSTGIAPWQDDFFTSAIGHAAEMGFTKANNLLVWKAKFPISRMIGDGACWLDAAIYSLKVRDSESSPFYDTIGQAYAKSHTADFTALQCNTAAMVAALGVKIGEMTGYAWGTTGYPSNMQPALAYAANVGGAAGKQAWAVFNTRTVKPDYRYAPQFAIVPR